jgi:uncharacterized protein
MRVRIACEAAGVEVIADLNDSSTSRALAGVMPLEAPAQRWGDELYFTVPVHHDHDRPVDQVESGDVGFWPPGDAFCIFFGQQPVGPVNPIGKAIGDATVLRAVEGGQSVRVELVPSPSMAI